MVSRRLMGPGWETGDAAVLDRVVLPVDVPALPVLKTRAIHNRWWCHDAEVLGQLAQLGVRMQVTVPVRRSMTGRVA